MPPENPAGNEDILRLLFDLVRDQGRVLNSIAESAAIGADRQQRVADVTDKMADVLIRLDMYLVREETANATARANLEAGLVEERAALTRLYDTVRKGLASSTGQRVVQTVVLAWLGWAGVHYGFVTPAVSVPAVPVVVPAAQSP